MTLKQLEKRIAALEVKVETLPKAYDHSIESWLSDAGMFADDPVFTEIVRRGRAYRKALRPKPRKTGQAA